MESRRVSSVVDGVSKESNGVAGIEPNEAVELQSGSVRVIMTFADECSIEDALSHYLAMRSNAARAIKTAAGALK